MSQEPLYNLWYQNDLIVQYATWKQVELHMAERGLHKDDVDIELVDGDAA